MQQLSMSILLMLSGLFGVKDLPITDNSDWKVEKPWQQNENGFFEVEFSSNEAIRICQQNPNGYLNLPLVVHGVHELAIDGHGVYVSGDERFTAMRSIYSSPSVECRALQNGEILKWRVISYSKYFARVRFLPTIEEWPVGRVTGELIFIFGIGALVAISLLSWLMFYGKVSRVQFVLISTTSLMIATFFIFSIAGVLGFNISMLSAHRFGDLTLTLGFVTYIGFLEQKAKLPKIINIVGLSGVGMGVILLLVGKDPETLQLGTSLLFPFVLVGLLILTYKNVTGAFRASKNRNLKLLKSFMQVSVLSICIHDIMSTLGIFGDAIYLPFGFMLAIGTQFFDIHEGYLELQEEKAHLEKQKLQLEQERVSRETRLNIARTVAHDIKSPLSALKIAVDALGAESPAAQLIRSATERITKIADDLTSKRDAREGLTFSLREGEAKIRRLIEEKRTEASQTAVQISLNINTQLKADRSIIGSIDDLARIISNLINNSIEALKSQAGQVVVDLEIDENNLMIEIRDTGPGFSTEILEKVKRGPFSTKGPDRGVGLSSAQSSIQAWGGRMEIGNWEKGSRVLIALRTKTHGERA